MEIGKVQYFEKIENPKQRDFLKAHNNCILCGSTLELLHVRIEAQPGIKEEASCKQCDLRTRAKVYTLN